MRHVLAAVVGCAVLASGSVAHAFCGFYVSGASQPLTNDATMVVMMREGTRTVLSMRNDYAGPAEDFAMVVPVPVVLQQENVKTLPAAIFDRVDQLAAPRLVEYWEQDPCQWEGMTRNYGYGRGSGGAMRAPMSAAREDEAERPRVRIEAQFVVGEYEIVILSADDSTSLDTWLRAQHYNIPQGAEEVLRPYVAAGMKFFVAKVDVERVRFEGGRARLSPLRFHYDTEDFSLPVRLGLLNSAGTQDLVVHVLARGQRYEAANYGNVFVPTNLSVADRVRTGFPGFYAALFDRLVQARPNAVVTEYSWQATSCDPCPVQPLQPAELASLGADVLPQGTARPAGRYADPSGGFVLTRLHYRYTRGALGRDLTFRAASPVIGGREVVLNDMYGRSRAERGVHPSDTNNFQARYVIRHFWVGRMTCANPVRGVWGDPPYDVPGFDGERTRAAGDPSRAPRNVRLEDVLRQSVPEIGFTHTPASRRPRGNPAP